MAVAVAVAGLTKRFFNHIQKDFLINVWGYRVGMAWRVVEALVKEHIAAIDLEYSRGQELCDFLSPTYCGKKKTRFV